MWTALLTGGLLVAIGSGSVLAQSDGDLPIYRFDPALVVDTPPTETLPSGAPVVVERNGDQTSIRLQTGAPLAPYLGAERGTQLSAEELRLLPEGEERDAAVAYKLEAGVGLFVEDKTSVNLGYRFHNEPSLLNERRNDPLNLSGDLRIGFDLKLPFD
jgi:hypothetical protein